MVAGIEKFRKYFAGHEDQYAVIGGSSISSKVTTPSTRKPSRLR